MKTLRLALLAITIGIGAIAGVWPLIQPAEAQGTPSTAFPLTHFPTLTFTATSQTFSNPIAAGAVSTVTIQVLGSSLTTATWQILASNDGGAHYYGIPVSTGAFTSNVLNATTAATVTTTSSSLYYADLAGFDHYEIVTSGTFTATNVKFIVTGGPIKGIF